LLIPSVNAETGEAMIWDRHGDASLPEALAASTAFPATAPPITINGHRYIDVPSERGPMPIWPETPAW
jgi:NTE family protein